MRAKNICRLLVFSLGVSTVFSGCGEGSAQTEPLFETDTQESTETAGASALAAAADMADFQKEDTYEDWKTGAYTEISLNGDSADITGAGAAADGQTVTVSQSGTYVLSGTLENGQIVISGTDADKVRLVFDGVTINCENGPAIVCTEADELAISLEADTENRLSDGSAYENEDYTATVYSKADTVFNGTGTLFVAANVNNGIQSKDDLRIVEGTYTIVSADDGLVGKDKVAIAGGNITIQSDGDGMKSTNAEDTEKGFIYIGGGNFRITSGTDGIQAETALLIDGGTFTLDVGDDAIHADDQLTLNDGEFTVNQCYEGLESANLVINGGEYDITSADDAVNAAGGTTDNDADDTAGNKAENMPEQPGAPKRDGGAMMPQGDTQENGMQEDFKEDREPMGRGPGGMGSASTGNLTINGGTLLIHAGGDGIDVNGDALMTGGIVTVEGPSDDGNTALDYDGTFTVEGGTLLAVGSAGMMQGLSESSAQSFLAAAFDTQAADTTVTLKDAAGDTIAEYTPGKAYASLIYSSDTLKKGETYRVCAGSTILTETTI